VADDGALTIAVGDATGHGLKAGTVVTAMKSLFHCYAGEPELHPVLNQSSRVLKKMNLRSMFMGLTVIRLKDCSLKISSAGMPPVLIYRARDGVVDEVLIKAVPLGSISSYQYRELEMDVSLGDVVVMMSDGLPERFNQGGEMFDYARVKEALTEAGALSSQQIIDHFVESGEKWANGRLQDDDMTFVVLKKNKPFAD
jgi:serine phosphatase RsbU (regulator of sigma subunit)